MLPVSLNNPEKLATYGTQDKDKKNKNNPEKLAIYGTQDKDKKNKNNPEKLATYGTQDEEKRLVYHMLPVSLGCFCFSCLCLVYHMFPVSLGCFCFSCLCQKLATYGTQDEEKQSKNNPEKLATYGTQDKDKKNKNNPEKLEKVLPGSLTDISAWVGFCTSSSQQSVKYQL
jgi:hypothetical protein